MERGCFVTYYSDVCIWKFRFGLSGLIRGCKILESGLDIWEFPKTGGTLLWGPYNKDPTI